MHILFLNKNKGKECIKQVITSALSQNNDFHFVEDVRAEVRSFPTKKKSQTSIKPRKSTKVLTRLTFDCENETK